MGKDEFKNDLDHSINFYKGIREYAKNGQELSDDQRKHIDTAMKKCKKYEDANDPDKPYFAKRREELNNLRSEINSLSVKSNTKK